MEVNESLIILKERYEILINFFLDSTALGYNDNSKLRLNDDYKIMDLIKVMEPEKYHKKLKELNEPF